MRGSRVHIELPDVSTEQLIERWWSPSGRLLAGEAFRFLRGERALPEQIGLHRGLVDLRGLGFPPMTQDQDDRDQSPHLLRVSSLEWAGLDLGHAWLPRVHADRLRIHGCVFDEAYCRHWRIERAEVAQTTFLDADLHRSTLGTATTGAAHLWEAVQFDRARMCGVRVVGGQMAGCTFVDANLDDAVFHWVELRNCVFAGPVGRVRFNGRGPTQVPLALMDLVDLSAADVARVAVVGYRKRRVALPPGALWREDGSIAAAGD